MQKKTQITIAIVGKGGVGKTTMSGIIINRLIKHNCEPILVVDADPNTGLDTALGIKVDKTVGGIREETRTIVKNGTVVNISKQELLEIKIAESLVEAEKFDFIAMGRPEGPGCYCYANSVLKSTLGKISHEYPYIVIDNEAGLENLSRRLSNEVNLLILVSDPSKQGMRTIERLYALTHEMGIKYNQLGLIINRLRNSDHSDEILNLKSKIQADYLIEIQDNLEIIQLSEAGKDLLHLPENNEVLKSIDLFLSSAGLF